MQIEDKIRDELAGKLDLFGMDLELVSKEHYIPEINTTKSFIDILAKDNENNYIIIEVKRSNQSSRQAIHEVIKYTEAIIDKYNVTQGEVKSIIVSTEWKELFVPFSAFVNESKNTTLGFEISVNEDFRITSINQITPCKTKNGRLFSPIQNCSLYYTEENMGKGIISHFDIYEQKGISDFVLVKLKAPPIDHKKYKEDLEEMLANILGEDKSNFKGQFDDLQHKPYMIYSAFQRLDKETYFNTLKKDKDLYEETKEFIESDLTDEDDIIETLESNAIFNTKPWFYSDETEIGSPAKFRTKILEDEKWEIMEIIRSETLQSNLLLTDSKILSEIKGKTGVSNVELEAKCDINHIALVNEIKENSKNCLKHNVIWRNDIDNFITEKSKLHNGKMRISIFSPNNIILTIMHMITEEEPLRWLPNYFVEFNSVEENRVFLGTFHWTGKVESFEFIVDKYYHGDPINILNPMIWGGHEDRNDEIMKDLGLTYESYSILEPESNSKIFHYYRYSFNQVNKIQNGLIELINTSEDFVSKLAFMHKTGFHKVEANII
jgi:hypothetical protein